MTVLTYQLLRCKMLDKIKIAMAVLMLSSTPGSVLAQEATGGATGEAASDEAAAAAITSGGVGIGTTVALGAIAAAGLIAAVIEGATDGNRAPVNAPPATSTSTATATTTATSTSTAATATATSTGGG
jgi:hypothetical protein